MKEIPSSTLEYGYTKQEIRKYLTILGIDARAFWDMFKGEPVVMDMGDDLLPVRFYHKGDILNTVEAVKGIGG